MVEMEFGLTRPEKPGEVSDFITGFVSRELIRKVCLGVLTMPIEGRAVMVMLRALARFNASEQRLQRSVPKADDLLPRVTLMLEHFPSFGPAPGDGEG
jgi:hypothetical protein